MLRLSLIAIYVLALIASHWVRDTAAPGVPVDPGQHVVQVRETAKGNLTGREISMAYWDLPAGEEGLQKPIVVLHGSPVATPAMWPLMDELTGSSRIIAPDLPGMGASTRVVADYSFQAHALAVIELLDHLEVEKVHLVAYSMGGGVALEILRTDPARVESLAMVSALGVQELELLGDYSLNHIVHGLQFSLLWMLQELTPHFGLLDRFPLNTSYARNFLDSDQRPMRGILEDAQPPMLIVHGEDDAFVPAVVAREHARIVPQSILESRPGGHLIVITDPEMVAKPLADFLKKVESGNGVSRRDAAKERIAAAEDAFDFRIHGEREFGFQAMGAVLLGLATLASEDLACISGGLLVARGALSFLPVVLGCFGGIVLGDVLLFMAGRLLGARALRRRPWCWLVSEERVERCAALFRRRGGTLVLTARFLPGLRLPTYFAAGAVGMNPGSFLLYFLGAALLWTPLLVGAALLIGDQFLVWAERAGSWGWVVGLTGVVVLWGGSRLVLAVSTHRGRRLLYGRIQRLARWEFWPAWVVYPPVVAYILWLGIRYRGFTLFTAVNPAMPCGGVAGESKAEILGSFPDGLAEIARFATIEPDANVGKRMNQLEEFMEGTDLSFPVVLKPDVGERGQGVSIVRGHTEAAKVLARCTDRIVAQEYVGGVEYGVFYARLPSEQKGRVISITAKHLTSVCGDGVRTLEALILDDARAVCMARFFLEKLASRLDEVPARGEVVRLTDLGTHCRGAEFSDGWEEAWSEVLEDRLDAVSKQYKGFYFGRYDLRTPSAGAIREKGEFRVLEVNGVTSECTHMYDSRYSLFQAWNILFTQWRLAFLIGAENRIRGHRPATMRDFFSTISRHFGREKFEA